MITKFNILLLLIFIGNFSFAQKESNIWYFGDQAGIDFNNNTRTALTDGQLNILEGCASVADSNGSLLFYTDGDKVWNKNHTIMTSSLMGGASSTEAALIVQKPGSSTLYYIFTTDDFAGPNGLRYSIVDMTLNSGLGGFISINNLITTPVEEKVIAVKHYNNEDFWIITHRDTSSRFLAYLLTSSGLNMIPVASDVGLYIPTGPVPSNYNAIGHMKASPERSKIAVSHTYLHTMEIFDFDNSTGILSNLLLDTNFSGSTNGSPYGVEFSPNGNLLYLSLGEIAVGINTKDFYQYNLLAGSNTAIINSRVSLFSNQFSNPGTIQLGPDHKIYRTDGNNVDSIGVVENPNNLGLACNFNINGFYLSGMNSKLGLPPLNRFFEPFDYTNLCFGDTALFNNTIPGLDSLKWDFGDTLSGFNNTSILNTPVHYFLGSGNYLITLITFNGLTIDTFSVVIHIKPFEFNGLGIDTTLCQGDILTLSASPSYAGFLWQDGSTDSAFTVNAAGTYWLEASHSICTASDTIIINYTPLPIINIGNDSTLCPSQEIVLNASTPGASYLWQDASTDSIFSVTLAGTYWVTVTVNNCSTTDSITISYTTAPTANLGNDTTLCQGDVLILDASFTNASYLWQDNSTNPTLNLAQPGQYWVNVSNSCGNKRDTINVFYFTPTLVSINSFNPDTLCSNGNTVVLPIGSPVGGTYSGNGIIGGSFDPIIGGVGTHNIIYSLVDTNGCVNDDTTIITVNLCVGIDENENELDILIYPNPNTGKFTIEKGTEINNPIEVIVLDMHTKKIVDTIIPKESQKIEIDITTYGNGIYFLQLSAGEKIVIKRVFKNQ